MSRLFRTAVALALGFSLAGASAWASAAELRNVLFLRNGDSAEAALIESLRIQLSGNAQLIELWAAPTSPEAGAAWQSMRATLEVWIDPETHEVRVARASMPDDSLTLGAAPTSAESGRVSALKLSELLEEEAPPPLPPPPPAPPHPPSTRAFIELRGGLSGGGSPHFWLPSLAFASGPRLGVPGGFLEGYGAFALAADIRSLSNIGQIDTSVAYFGVGGRALARSGDYAIGPYFELGLMVLRARGFVDPKHQGAQEVGAPVFQPGLELRASVLDQLEIRAAAGPEIWLERQRLDLHATPILDFGRVRAAGSVSAVFLLF